MQGYGETRAKAQEVDTPDPDERIRQLCEENRRLRKQIRQLKAAAAKKKVEFSKLVFLGVSIVRFLLHKGQGREQDQDHGGVWRAAGAVKL